MNKYLEEGYFKSEYIFYKLIINRWSIRFTKPMTDYEILADSQHYQKVLGTRNLIFGRLTMAEELIIWWTSEKSD